MAQGVLLERERFCCSICLDLLNDPVTILCGHSYCMECINNHFESEAETEIYSCPQCRQIFMPKPVLVKNNMLAFVIEELKRMETNTSAPIKECYAGPEDVACDICSGKKLKAVKSCLQCLASYCKKHLQPHKDVPALKIHKLTEATAALQECICSQHQEVMKMFCRTDQCCICYLCSKDEHKDHDTVTAAAERAERQRELEVSLRQIQQRIREKREDVKAFEQEEDTINNSADKAFSNAEKIFTELIKVFEGKLSEMRKKVLSQQEAETRRFRKLRNKVEEEIGVLREQSDKLEKLLHTEDNILFLLSHPSSSHVSTPINQPSLKLRRMQYFEKFVLTVSEARDKLQEVLEEECAKIFMTRANHLQLLRPTLPETKADIPNVNHVPQPETKADIPNVNHVPLPETKADIPVANHVPLIRELPPETITPAPQISRDRFPTTADFLKTRLLKNTVTFSPNISDSTDIVDHYTQQEDDSAQTETCLMWTREPLQTPPDRIQSRPDVLQTYCPEEDPHRPDVLQTSLSDLLARARKSIRRKPNFLKTRAELLKFACPVSLNPDTANPHLFLSKENRKVIFSGAEQNYPSNPERFAYSWQVLSQEALSEHCYLEVETSDGGVLVAVTYKDISRAGTFTECMFGHNNKSWALDCFKNSYEFRHNNVKTSVHGMWSSRVGVYLDHRAGILSFYSISDRVTLLHTVQTTFTEPLYAGLWLSDGGTAEVCQLRRV